jgi:hypothetical protein
VGSASGNKSEKAQAIEIGSARENGGGKHHVVPQAALYHAFAAATSHTIPYRIWGDRHCPDWTQVEVIVKMSDAEEQSRRSE